jgi:NAD(P)-dependent dehydrogenase (short-subunit alcohol dehydrogenase family)
MIPQVKAKLLDAKKGLIVGIANENSIAWGCAKAFRAFGAEVAVTYLNEKERKYVEPLARELEALIVMPLDVGMPGQIEAVFQRITKDWGKLDFVVHSIAFSPKEALQGRVVDVSRDGFLTTMDVSCWTFIRMAHLAEPLMKKGGTLFTMTYYSAQSAEDDYKNRTVPFLQGLKETGYVEGQNVAIEYRFGSRSRPPISNATYMVVQEAFACCGARSGGGRCPQGDYKSAGQTKQSGRV